MASNDHGKLPWSKVKELADNNDDKNVMLTNRAKTILFYVNYIFSWKRVAHRLRVEEHACTYERYMLFYGWLAYSLFLTFLSLVNNLS